MKTKLSSLRDPLRISEAWPTQMLSREGTSIEMKDAEMQTDDFYVLQRIEEIDYELNLSLEIEKRPLRWMIAHKTEILKLTSQVVHYTFFGSAQ